MGRSSDARQRAIETAERLIRRQGYAATGLIQILAESGAPKGSFYFHFPGGKAELAAAVLDGYGARVEQAIRSLAAARPNDPAGFLRALCTATAREMAESDWTSGCAVQAIAAELAPLEPLLTAQAAEIFARWTRAIAEGLRAPGRSQTATDQAALHLLSALEGARTLARTMKSPAPFEAIAQTL